MPDPSTISVLDQSFEPDVVRFGGGGLTAGDDTEPYFFGLTSDIGFTTVTFAAAGDWFGFGFDNVSFSSVAPVPLPAPLAMLAFSIVGLFTFRKFRAA